MSEHEKSFSEIFATLSQNAKKLLISITHAATEVGMSKDAAMFTADLEPEKFASATQELLEKDLLQTGKFTGTQNTFIFDKKGGRLRLSEEIQTRIFEDILKLPKPKEIFKTKK